MDKDTLLLKYFAGSLNTEEKKVFQSLMENDTEFQLQVALEEDVQRVVQHSERSALKLKLKEFETQLPKEGLKTVSKTTTNYLKIAASFAILIAATWFIYQWSASPNLNDLYAANYEKFPNTVYTITRSDTLDNSLERKAFEAYEGGNIEAAITYFEELIAVSNLDYIPFYLGQSYLQGGKTEKALLQFESIVKHGTDFKSEALWYVSLAYLKLENQVKAKRHLELLVLEGNYKKELAQELIKTLD